jgi:hypothetical protein
MPTARALLPTLMLVRTTRPAMQSRAVLRVSRLVIKTPPWLTIEETISQRGAAGLPELPTP